MVNEGPHSGDPPHGEVPDYGQKWCHTRVQELAPFAKMQVSGISGVNLAEIRVFGGLVVNTLW